MGDTAPALPSIDSLSGRTIGGFVVKQRLSEGGMGMVYLAEHQTIGMRAAVKFLRPEVANSAEWTARFLTEARALAALNNRNLVKVSEFGATTDGLQYLVMEFIEGSTLEQYLSEQNDRGRLPLAPAQALQFAEQILNGLGEAHKKGIVHRDLKPANIMKGSEHGGQVVLKIVDFGLARQDTVALLHESPSRENQASLLAGTPEYIAPEQARGLRGDGRADLYALGVMLYEMLSGHLPFKSESVVDLMKMHAFEVPPPLAQAAPGLPEGVCEFVHQLLEKEPDKRPGNADVARQTTHRLLKALERDSTSIKAMPTRHAETSKIERPVTESTTAELIARSVSRRRGRGLVVAIAGVAALVLLWLLWPVTPAPGGSVLPEIAAPVVAQASPSLPAAEPILPAPVPLLSPDNDLANLTKKVRPQQNKPPAAESNVEAAASPPRVELRPSGWVIEKFPRCADLGEWRSEEKARADEIDARVRERLIDQKVARETIESTLASLRPVQERINRASTGEQCAAASQSLDAWAEAHGL